jgi:hypothetical protein
VYYYNTTSSDRVLKTGVSVFRHALLVHAFLAVSDAPIEFDLEEWKERMMAYPWEGRDRRKLEEIASALAPHLEREESLRARTQTSKLITDDNMGTEWE